MAVANPQEQPPEAPTAQLAASADDVQAAARELESCLALPSNTADWRRDVADALRGTRRALDEDMA